GFIWYESQLSITPPIFLIFVPDSPMASMFFTIFLLFFLFDKKVPYIESLALITLFKYGVWAVVMNLLTLITTGNLSPQGYMFIWYESQLSITPPIFLIFVPDSPMASMFFTIFLLFFLFDKNVPYIESLALITLFKYGVWAVVMNLLTLITTGNLSPQGYMLIASH